MSKLTEELILKKTAYLFARQGIDNFSIRYLARELDAAPSAVYYYFTSEDHLLKSMFHFLNRSLGQKRAALPQPESAYQMLKQRIEFQIDNQEAIVAVLKYYLFFRGKFSKFKEGFLPDKSSLHIEEVLLYGEQTKEFSVKDIENDSKVITHAINGFLLEYFPYTPSKSEKKRLINRIYSFLIRAL